MQTPNRDIRPRDGKLDNRIKIAGFIGCVALAFVLGLFLIGPWLKAPSQPVQPDAMQGTTDIPRPQPRPEAQPTPETAIDPNVDVQITEKDKAAESADTSSTETPSPNSVNRNDNSLNVTLDPADDSHKKQPDEPAVRIEPEKPKSTEQPRAATETNHNGSSKTKFRVQAGTFANVTNAENLANDLKSKGYNAQIKQVQVEDRTLYRVQVGEYKNKEDAQELANDLSATGYTPSVLPDH